MEQNYEAGKTIETIETIDVILCLPNSREQFCSIDSNKSIVETIADKLSMNPDQIIVYSEDSHIQIYYELADCCILPDSRLTVNFITVIIKNVFTCKKIQIQQAEHGIPIGRSFAQSGREPNESFYCLCIMYLGEEYFIGVTQYTVIDHDTFKPTGTKYFEYSTDYTNSQYWGVRLDLDKDAVLSDPSLLTFLDTLKDGGSKSKEIWTNEFELIQVE